MRAVIAGCALLLVGTAARAQPYDGDGYPPPPPYDGGYGHRFPPPPPFGDGYGRRPAPRFHDGGFDDPPPPRRRHRRCRVVEDFDGPHRTCRPDF